MNYIKITATVNVSNKSYSGFKRHVKHDPNLRHSNKDIDSDRTKFNQSEILISNEELHKIQLYRYQKQFEKYNFSQQKSGHKSRMFKDVSEYLKSKEKTNSFDKSMIATFGNMDNQSRLLAQVDSEDKSEFFNLQSSALSNYARSFNQRNKYLKIAQYTTNVDESTPHVHMQLITLGRTKKGKPSMSFNAALKSEYMYKTGKEITDTRKALSWFRESEDNALVNSMNDKIDLNYELTRTNEHVEDFDGYKQLKESFDFKEMNLNIEQTNFNLEKRNFKLDQNRTKKNSVKLLEEIEPEHKTDDEKAEPVQSNLGKEQHLKKPLNTVFDYVFYSLKKFKKKEEKLVQGFKDDFKKVSTSVFNFSNEVFKNKISNYDIDKLSNFENKKVEVHLSDGQVSNISPVDAVISVLHLSFKKVKKMSDKNKLRSKELDEREMNLKIREQKLHDYELGFNSDSKKINEENNVKKKPSSHAQQLMQQMIDKNDKEFMENAINNSKNKDDIKEKNNNLTVEERINRSIKGDMLDDFNERLERHQKNHRRGPHMHM